MRVNEKLKFLLKIQKNQGGRVGGQGVNEELKFCENSKQVAQRATIVHLRTSIFK